MVLILITVIQLSGGHCTYNDALLHQFKALFTLDIFARDIAIKR